MNTALHHMTASATPQRSSDVGAIWNHRRGAEQLSDDDPDLELTYDDMMQRAAEACDLLELNDPLRPKLLELLGDVRSRMTETRADRGRRPPVPDKRQYVNQLGASHPRRPARKAVRMYGSVRSMQWSSSSTTCGAR